MKTNKEIIEELKKIKIDHTDSDNDGFNRLCSTEISKIMNLFTQALEQKEREVREKALNDFFQAVDARYKDFEITQAMGKILQNLKQPKE